MYEDVVPCTECKYYNAEKHFCSMFLIYEKITGCSCGKKKDKGSWIKLKNGTECVCSSCHKYYINVEEQYDFNYCPRCGDKKI